MSAKGEKTQAAVLSVLRRHHGAVTAYEVLGELRQKTPTMAPTTVYRALTALSERGLVRRLESLNAFIASKDGGHDRASILTICDDCGSVEESVAPDLLAEVSRVAGQSGFAAERHVIELHGRCASCDDGKADR